ncbi:MAG: hypothetical protein OEX12_12375 [Gammaproteobacteria bacterium]|nr:hypothetical protein [Gammaproteobacteria bacterium]
MNFLGPQRFIAIDGACLNRNLGLRSSLLPALLFLLSFVLSPAHATPLLVSDTETAAAGYYQLSWEYPSLSPTLSVLEESDHEDFSVVKIIYQGSDRASVFSGKPDGDYYYRLKLISPVHSQYSNTVRVIVKHHSLYKAWWFFLLGAVVFVTTTGLIYLGSRPSGPGNE